MVGVAHDKYGEVPRGFVVKKDPGLTESEVAEFVNGEVAKYKRLEGGVVFIEAIPKSAAGKILRRQLGK